MDTVTVKKLLTHQTGYSFNKMRRTIFNHRDTEAVQRTLRKN